MNFQIKKKDNMTLDNKGIGILGALISSSIVLISLIGISNLVIKLAKTSKKMEEGMVTFYERQQIEQWFENAEICTQTLTQTHSVTSEEASAEEVKYKIPFEKDSSDEFTLIDSVTLYSETQPLIIKNGEAEDDILERLNFIQNIKKIELAKTSDLSNNKYKLLFHLKKSDSQNPFYQAKAPEDLSIEIQTVELDSSHLKITSCGKQNGDTPIENINPEPNLESNTDHQNKGQILFIYGDPVNGQKLVEFNFKTKKLKTIYENAGTSSCDGDGFGHGLDFVRGLASLDGKLYFIGEDCNTAYLKLGPTTLDLIPIGWSSAGFNINWHRSIFRWPRGGFYPNHTIRIPSLYRIDDLEACTLNNCPTTHIAKLNFEEDFFEEFDGGISYDVSIADHYNLTVYKGELYLSTYEEAVLKGSDNSIFKVNITTGELTNSNLRSTPLNARAIFTHNGYLYSTETTNRTWAHHHTSAREIFLLRYAERELWAYSYKWYLTFGEGWGNAYLDANEPDTGNPPRLNDFNLHYNRNKPFAMFSYDGKIYGVMGGHYLIADRHLFRYEKTGGFLYHINQSAASELISYVGLVNGATVHFKATETEEKTE